MKLYIGIDMEGHINEISIPDPKDRWDRASTSTDWSIRGIKYSEKDEYGLLPIEIEYNKPVHVVYAIWSSGDSFGHDERYCCEALSVHLTRKEAQAEVERLKTITDYSVPWNGYFESLDELNIVSGVIYE